MFDLTGKTAIVTGGGRGLGTAIVEAFCEQGAVVSILEVDESSGRRVADQVNESCGREAAFMLSCDIRDEPQVQKCVTEIHQQHERIDILVNNAGIHRRGLPEELSQEDIQAVLNVNLLGSFYVARAVGPLMVKQRSGSIINMSALGGGIVGLGRGGSIYGITKGAIVAMTRDLSAEWGKYGVRVNSLAPGWIRTPMTIQLQQDEERSAKMLERVPLRRWGEAKEVAGAAVFLASDASAYVTGHTIPIDGGAANVIGFPE